MSCPSLGAAAAVSLTRDNHPWIQPEDKRDAYFLQQRLDDCLQQFRLPKRFVTVVVRHVQCEDIHKLPKKLRHMHVAEMIRYIAPSCYVQWCPDGHPELIPCGGEQLLQVAVAHEERLYLVSIGHGPQGCDLTPISCRTAETWRRLLGATHFFLAHEMASLHGNEVDLDTAASMVWAAMEASRKATWCRANALEFRCVTRLPQALAWIMQIRCSDESGEVCELAVATFPMTSFSNLLYAFAFTLCLS
mmetsp:Transcript_14672/g.25070  ORF Transcript_14672/g.25070 Transcript_14672/m.25070 type:complete len:247 (-) Transcript_14672:205-945(-)